MRQTSLLAAAMAVAGSLCSQVPAQQPAQPAKKQVTERKVELLPTEVDAVGWALDALLLYPETARPHVRFIWLPPWADPEWVGVMDFAVNASCSQVSVLVKGDLHAGGYLLGYDLRRLVETPEQLARLVDTWDSLAARDSRLHVPETNLVDVITVIDVPGPVDPKTKQAGPAIKKSVTNKSKRTVAALAPHLQEALAVHASNPALSERVDVLVTQLTRSTGAVYPADFMLEQLLTSLVGKYPEFRQMDFDTSKLVPAITPLQQRLKINGFFFENSQDLRGLKAVWLNISGVTGKNRIVATAFGLTSRQPLAMTFDIKDDRSKLSGVQFIRNVVEFVAFTDAAETFVPMRNKLLEYLLSDAKQNLLRAAPSDVVCDDTKPPGHTKDLEMGMSCVMCHLPDGGYKTNRNDMEGILGSDIDFFGDDFSYVKQMQPDRGKRVRLTREQAVDLVVGQYGEPIYLADGILGRAERDFVAAIDQLTSHKERLVAGGPNSAQLLGVKVKEIYHGYRYTPVNAQRLCLELGIRVDEDHALEVLRLLVPPRPKGHLEDVMIGLARGGTSLKRDDLDSVYVDMMRVAIKNRVQFAEPSKN